MATLTVTIREDLNLNGRERGSEITHEISSITETYHRIMDVLHTADMVLLEMDPTPGNTEGQKFHDDDVKYVRITNLDGSNFVILSVIDSGAHEYAVKLEAGDTYILNNKVTEANAAGDSSVGASLGAITSISAQANTATCQVEVFAAIA
jgi:hypothetical protein